MRKSAVRSLPSEANIALVLAWISVCALSAWAQEQRPYRQARYIMGTVCEITAYAVPERAEDADKKQQNRTDYAIDSAFEHLKAIDGQLSNWKAGSELMQMNRAAAAAGEPRPRIKVSDGLFARLRVALEVAEKTDGWFDPTVGPLVRAYGFLPKKHDPDALTDAQLSAARPKVGWQKVHLDAEKKTVWFDVPGMEIDLGGIAKGYSAARAAQVLRENGVTAGFVNLGESSMVAVGAPPGKQGWLVEVYDPRDRKQVVASIVLKDGESVATSGLYENVKVVRGSSDPRDSVRKAHIVNPRTGEALAAAAFSVTVVLDDAERADGITKPFFFAKNIKDPTARKVLDAFPKASVMLVSVQKGRLRSEFAGAQPDRFHPMVREKQKHAH